MRKNLGLVEATCHRRGYSDMAPKLSNSLKLPFCIHVYKTFKSMSYLLPNLQDVGFTFLRSCKRLRKQYDHFSPLVRLCNRKLETLIENPVDKHTVHSWICERHIQKSRYIHEIY